MTKSVFEKRKKKPSLPLMLIKQLKRENLSLLLTCITFTFNKNLYYPSYHDIRFWSDCPPLLTRLHLWNYKIIILIKFCFLLSYSSHA